MKKLLLLLMLSCIALSQNFEIIKIRDFTFPGNVRNFSYAGNTLFVVGFEFNVISFFGKSTNEGLNWQVLTPKEFSKENNLTAISFVNSQVGFVAGNNGVIYKTTNGGQSWIFIADTTFYNGGINDIYAFNDSTLVVVGSYSTKAQSNVIITRNNGKNWSKISTNNDRTLYRIKVFAPNQIFMVGSSKTILKSTDTLKTFTTIPITGGGTTLYDITKVDSLNYVIVGTTGNFAKSSNGGTSFIAIDTTDSKQPLYAVSFIGNKGIAIGSNGEWYRSFDGGNTWTIIPALTTEVLKASIVVNNKIIVGGYQSVMFYTTDFGNNWKDIANSYRNFYSVYVENQNNFLAVGGSADGTRCDASYTTDGGESWNKLPIVIQNTLLDGYKKGNYVVVCGNKSTFYYTKNLGTLWTNKSYGYGATTFQYKVHFFNVDTGYIANSDGEIYFTTNSGNSFITCISEYAQKTKFYDIQMISKTRGFAVGTGKKIYETFNGTTFVSEGLAQIKTAEIRGISMLNENVGYICGTNGAVYKTNNAFLDVTLISDTIKYSGVTLRSIAAINENSVWAVGVKTTKVGTASVDSGIVMKLVNGSMQIVANLGANIPTRIVKLGTNSYLISALNAKVYKIIDNDATTSNEKFSKNTLIYDILPNYPNPFNPTTNIKVVIPKTSNIKLNVYDITGKVIKTIYTGQISAGVHQFELNGNNLSSGIYFCRLESDNFTKSIKMILMK